MTPMMIQTGHRQQADAAQIPADRLKAFIETRLRRRDKPAHIAAAVHAYFGIAIDPDQLVPFWKGEIALPTQTEHRPDKESVQFAADEPQEPSFTRLADADTTGATSEAAAQPYSIAPHPVIAAADESDRPATQTGRRQDSDSLQIPADPVDEPAITREAREAAIEALGALARARLGIAPDAAELSASAAQSGPAENADGAPVEGAATQTGRRQNHKTKSVLTDEMKAFIVRGLARYETPTRVAASVRAEFGVEIDRRQVYAYDPAGSRPPARRWIDLHAATRAKFLNAAAEIGVAQKVVRLRMLDRFANLAEERNHLERAAKFLAQAANECGGFYERFARPAAPAPASR